MAAFAGDRKKALEKAKESSTKERSVIRQREQAGLADSHNLDLTFSVKINNCSKLLSLSSVFPKMTFFSSQVLLNLACQYEFNEMYSEALNTYDVLTKNKMFQNAGRLKANMANIYLKMGQYNKALKFYRMALDQVPNTNKTIR